jgi:uncharacterized protein YecE (DUF72 family)
LQTHSFPTRRSSDLGKIQDWRKKGKTVFVYFNNDAYGFAVKNALTLKKFVSQDRTTP